MSKIICIAGYKGRSLFPSKFIKWITWSEITHVAPMFPDDDGIVYEAWSNEGVRMTRHLSDKHDAGTEVIVKYLKVTDQQLAIIKHALISQLGKQYDWKGCFRFFPMARLIMSDHPSESEQDKWFCSELTCWALGQAGIKLQDKSPYMTSPADVMVSTALTFLTTHICGVSDYKEVIRRAREVS